MNISKCVKRTAIAAILGVSGLLAVAAPASAYVVCNAEGDCWHTIAGTTRVRDMRGIPTIGIFIKHGPATGTGATGTKVADIGAAAPG